MPQSAQNRVLPIFVGHQTVSYLPPEVTASYPNAAQVMEQMALACARSASSRGVSGVVRVTFDQATNDKTGDGIYITLNYAGTDEYKSVAKAKAACLIDFRLATVSGCAGLLGLAIGRKPKLLPPQDTLADGTIRFDNFAHLAEIAQVVSKGNKVTMGAKR